MGTLFLSLLKREQRDRREIQSTDLIHENSIVVTRVLDFFRSESFLLLLRSLSHLMDQRSFNIVGDVSSTEYEREPHSEPTQIDGVGLLF